MSKKRHLRLYIAIIAIITLFLYFFLQNNVPKHLRINEVAFSHENKVDWIEIYNPTINNLSLEGLFLSDKASDFSKFKIKEQVVVPSRGFVTIYCKDYDGDTTNSTITNFRIANGETIYLVAKDGSSVIDSIIAIADEDASSKVTVGRFPDGSDELFIMSEGTPGSQNKKDMVQGTPPMIMENNNRKRP